MKTSYNSVPIPNDGKAITFSNGRFVTPDSPVITYIEGDGTGRDIWRAARPVFDAAVAKASGGKRRIVWYEIFAGEKAFNQFGEWLPQGTLDAISDFRIAIKGPLITPFGGGIRSLNLALRQSLNLYVLWRPVKYILGVPSPVKHPEWMNIDIFRENTEDLEVEVEWRQGSTQAKRVIEFVNALLKEDKINKQIRPDSGVGFKPISITATKRLVRCGIRYALKHDLKTVTLVHKGSFMKFTDGAFRDWGYELAREEFRDEVVTEREGQILDSKDRFPSISIEMIATIMEPGLEKSPVVFQQQVYEEVKTCLDSIQLTHGNGQWKKKILMNDRLADSMLQQIMTRADEYRVVCTPNLIGDYFSDACAAQIGGVGLAPGANIGDGCGLFEAAHGAAPKYADKDMVNPTAFVRSGALMFEFIGWPEVGALIEAALAATIAQRQVTFDLERQMKIDGVAGVQRLSTTAFANAIIENIQEQ
jgi:isocitrate dehydrogenase